MSLTEVILLLISLIVIGALAGFLGGLFGMGGGVVLVPAFLGFLHFLSYGHTIAIKQAVGTSLFLVIPTGLGAVKQQIKLGNLDTKFCYRWIPYIIIGSVIGIFLSTLLPSTVLKIIFMAYLVICAIIMMVLSQQGKRNKKAKRPKPKKLARQIGGVVIGAFSVMLGIGGGTLAAPFLRLNHFSLRKALGLSSATTIAIGIIGTLGMILLGLNVPGRVPYSLGYLNLVAAVIIGPIMYYLSPMGVSYAHKLSKIALNTGYIVFLMLVFGYMFWHTTAPM